MASQLIFPKTVKWYQMSAELNDKKTWWTKKALDCSKHIEAVLTEQLN